MSAVFCKRFPRNAFLYDSGVFSGPRRSHFGLFYYLNNARVWLSVESAIEVEGLITRNSQISPYAAMVDHDLLEGPDFQDPGDM
jgi:hypothetical protein